MIFGRKKVRKNDMDDDFEEYNDEYDDFEIYPPMHEIRNDEDRTFTHRDKRVDFGKNRRREKGLPKREKSGPLNRNNEKKMSWGVPWKKY